MCLFGNIGLLKRVVNILHLLLSLMKKIDCLTTSNPIIRCYGVKLWCV